MEIARANNLYRRELEWMRRQPQARGHKARYREEAFVDLEKVAKQRIEERQMRLKRSNVYIGSKIFECQYVSKAFNADTQAQITILKDFYYNFARFEKMGIIGNNGTGKSTFIKMLLGTEQPDRRHGTIRLFLARRTAIQRAAESDRRGNRYCRIHRPRKRATPHGIAISATFPLLTGTTTQLRV